jgi:hypothetical protein
MVDYAMTLEENPGYVHATAIGERTAANALRFLEEAYQACVRLRKDALLIEVRFTGPSLSLGSIFAVIKERAPDGAALRRIAYVEPLLGDRGQASFAELVAVNRGVNAKLFSDVEAAREWLSEGLPDRRDH